MCRKNAAEKREKKNQFILVKERMMRKEERRKGTARENPCKKFAFFIRTFEGLFLPFFVRQTTQKKAVRWFFHNSTMMKMMANEAFNQRVRERVRGAASIRNIT